MTSRRAYNWDFTVCQQDGQKVVLLRLSLIIVNWEMFCWPADVHFAHAYFESLPRMFALVVCFELLCHSFACCFPPSRPPLGFLKFLCSGKFLLRFLFSTERSV